MGRSMILQHTNAASEPPSAAGVPPALEQAPGAAEWYRWRGEGVHYRVLGEGPPIVLVHTPDVGACCVEWRRNIGALAESHKIHAVDLPGFGLSDAKPHPYTAEGYVSFLADFLKDVAKEPACVVGSVLSAAYAVQVADRWPGLINRLVLVCPAGISACRPNLLNPVKFSMLRLPGLSSFACGTATSRFTILEHLQHDVYLNEGAAGSQAVEARYWVSHRPNADYVERSRMAGLLNADIRGPVSRLHIPVLAMWGRYAPSPRVDDLETLKELNPRARAAVFDRSALAPHEEEPGKFNGMVAQFLEM